MSYADAGSTARIDCRVLLAADVDQRAVMEAGIGTAKARGRGVVRTYEQLVSVVAGGRLGVGRSSSPFRFRLEDTPSLVTAWCWYGTGTATALHVGRSNWRVIELHVFFDGRDARGLGEVARIAGRLSPFAASELESVGVGDTDGDRGAAWTTLRLAGAADGRRRNQAQLAGLFCSAAFCEAAGL